MAKRFICTFIGILIVIIFSSKLMIAQEKNESSARPEVKELSLPEFLSLAVANDTEFERILIDELFLKYEKALNLPARDLVLEVKSQYHFMLDQNRREPAGTVSLSRLFPLSGTKLAAEYRTTPSYTSRDNTTEFIAEVSQPIAKNAFGKSTRLKDKIIGLETEVARHQIIEAYEDYLATTIIGYYQWYAAYQNLEIGKSSYQENLKLLDNILDRQQSNIALSIDVNKVRLQVLAKKEQLIMLEHAHDKALHFIETAIRYQGKKSLRPLPPDLYRDVDIYFERDYANFKSQSRTYVMLDLLEEKSQIEVDREANDLLPSIDLIFGYQARGHDFGIKEKEDTVYAGISLGWPFGQQVDKAEHKTAKIALEKTRLANIGTHFRLYTNLKDLSTQIDSESRLLDIAREKIDLAKSVLEDEVTNYSFGKVTLNDYIAAVNVLDNNRFNEIQHEIQQKRLIVEWLRITDRLVSRNEIFPR